MNSQKNPPSSPTVISTPASSSRGRNLRDFFKNIAQIPRRADEHYGDDGAPRNDNERESLVSFLVWIHTLFIRVTGLLQHPFLLALRLYWGYDFFQTGLGKLNNLERTTEFFASLQIPFPAVNAVFVGSLELVGGVLLLLGLASRYITVPLIVSLCVAYATDEKEALMHLFDDPNQFVTATPFLHMLASMTVFVFGAGALSADAVIGRWWERRKNMML